MGGNKLRGTYRTREVFGQFFLRVSGGFCALNKTLFEENTANLCGYILPTVSVADTEVVTICTMPGSRMVADDVVEEDDVKIAHCPKVSTRKKLKTGKGFAFIDLYTIPDC